MAEEQGLSSSTSSTRYARKQETIIAAATHILNRRGVKGMTLADVAASVGLITTSVTYYFKRKEDLAVACFLAGIERYEQLIAHAAEAPTPRERVSRLIGCYLDLNEKIRAREEPPLPIFSDIRALRDPHHAKVIEPFNALFRSLRHLIRCADDQWADRTAATARTHLLISQLFRFDSWLWRYDVADYPRIRERVADILLDGVQAQGQDWRPRRLPDLWSAEAADARESFLRAATLLINQRGYRGASVEKISAELNVTKGSFYHHNEAKDDVVVACFGRSFDLMRRAQNEAMRSDASWWEKLATAVASLVELQLSDSGPLIRSTTLNALTADLRHDMIEASNRVHDRFAAMLADGVAEGSVRPVDPMIAAHLIGATVNAAFDVRRLLPALPAAEGPAIYGKPGLMGLFVR